MLQRNPDIGHRKASYPSGLFLYLVFGVMSRYGRTNRRPGLCYPAKDQRELAAECRRLKSMLVPAKRPLPEISSCAHWPTLKPWQSLDAAFRPRLRETFTATRLFSIKQPSASGRRWTTVLITRPAELIERQRSCGEWNLSRSSGLAGYA